MKTQVLFFSALFGAFYCHSQITLTKYHSFDLGTTATYSTDSNTELDLSEDGENVVWDASSANVNSISTTSYISPDESSEAEYFPEANLVQSVPGVNLIHRFFEETETELIYHGRSVPNLNAWVNSDPLIALKFPINYGDAYSDNYEGTFTTFDNYYDPISITGNATVSSDAYGDLILPYGTIENTLRIKTIDSLVTLSEDIGNSENTITSYDWYDLEYGNKIAYYIVVQQSIDGVASEDAFVFGYVSEADYTSISEQREIPSVQVFPNPASDYFQISRADFGSEYKLINQQGQEVSSGILTGEERIYTTTFTSGVYFLEIRNNQGVIREKILIQ